VYLIFLERFRDNSPRCERLVARPKAGCGHPMMSAQGPDGPAGTAVRSTSPAWTRDSRRARLRAQQRAPAPRHEPWFAAGQSEEEIEPPAPGATDAVRLDGGVSSELERRYGGGEARTARHTARRHELDLARLGSVADVIAIFGKTASGNERRRRGGRFVRLDHGRARVCRRDAGHRRMPLWTKQSDAPAVGYLA